MECVNPLLRLVYSSLISTACAATACAKILPPPSLQRSADLAEIIVKARVLQPEPQDVLTTGPTGQRSGIRCRNVYVIKGHLPEAAFQFSLGPANRTFHIGSFRPGETYLLFLRRVGGEYVQIDETKAELSADPNLPATPPQGKSTTDRLREELLGWLGSRQKEAVLEALEFLPELGTTQEVIIRAMALAGSPDLEIRGAAIVAMIRLGEPSAIGDAIRYLEGSPTTSQSSLVLRQRMIGEISLIRDPAMARDLIPLMGHKDAAVRLRAAMALRANRVRAAVPKLASGLHDEDPHTRYVCLMALVEILDRMNPEWTTSLPRFAERGDELIGRWLHWWETEGKRIDWEAAPPATQTSQPAGK